jgi:hypothetical protein
MSKKKTFMGIKPKHKGYCTPMSKSTCTPRRKALAKRLKPGGDLYKGKKKYGGPLKELNDMQSARKGKAVGSLLEGGRIKYASGGPGPVSKGKEEFDKLQQYANNVSLYEKLSPYGLKKLYKKPLKRGEMSQNKLDQIIEVNKMNLPWDKFKRTRR